MRIILFFCCLLFASNSVIAQKNITEYWSNGLPKKTFLLRGSDTIQTAFFQENGFPAYKQWAKDSAYSYDILGRLRTQYYGLEIYPDGSVAGDNVVYFDESGNLERKTIRPDSTTSIRVTYFENKLIQAHKTVKLNDSTSHFEISDSLGKIFESGFRMFIRGKKNLEKDTIFFPNGIIKSINWADVSNYPNKNLYLKLNDINGKILLEMGGSESLILEKDNAECLYGFRNQKGEWAIPPQYFEVKEVILGIYLARTTEKSVLLNEKGEKILDMGWEYMDVMPNFNCKLNINNEPHYKNNIQSNALTFANSYENEKKKFECSYLKFRKGRQYGVADMKGKVILEPKYDNIRATFNGNFEVKIGKKWGVVNEKGEILLNPLYYEVKFTGTPDVFIVVDTFVNANKNNIESYGLVKNNQLLLPIEFATLIASDSSVFYASKGFYDQNKEACFYHLEKGLLFDKNFKVDFENNLNGSCKVFKNAQNLDTTTVGVVDSKGNWVLPAEFKKAYLIDLHLKPSETFDNETGYILQNEKGKYGLYNYNQKKYLLPFEYDNLVPVNTWIENNSNLNIQVNYIHLASTFLAKKDNKWQLIQLDGKPLLNQHFDYVGYYSYEAQANMFEGVFWVVKNDSLSFYGTKSVPNTTSFKDKMKLTDQNFFSLTDYEARELLFNRNGKLLLPPQYLIKNVTSNYVTAFDSTAKRYVLVDTIGKITFLNSQFIIRTFQKENDIVVVENPKNHKLGVTDLLGKTIIPCDFDAIVAAEKDRLLWLKKKISQKDEEKITFYFDYQESEIDENWTMHNKTGKILNNYKYAQPIIFKDSVGVGRATGNKKYGIWNTEGKTILTPQYDYIIRDTSEDVFYIFVRKKDSTFTIGFSDWKGKIIKEPIFDKMSRFYGNFSLVQTEGKTGVIDKKGNYLLPESGSFLNFRGNLLDSFAGVNHGQKVQDYRYFSNYQPQFRTFLSDKDFNSVYFSYDTLPKRYAPLMNLGVEKAVNYYSLKAYTDFNPRLMDSIIITPNFKKTMIRSDSKEMRYRAILSRQSFNVYKTDRSFFGANNLQIEGKFGGFVGLTTESNKKNIVFVDEMKTYNIHQTDDGKWAETSLSDWLKLTETNKKALNSLIFQKIKALKGENIDCSNGSSFYETAQNLYFIKTKGVAFFVPRQYSDYGRERSKREWNHAEILLIWDELKEMLLKRP